MSRTTIFEVALDGSTKEGKEFPNAWGSAPFIWGKMFDRYVPKVQSYDSWMNRAEALWPLAKDPRVPSEDQLVLASTYDNVVFRREALEGLADCYDRFAKKYPDGGKVVNHLPAMAAEFRLLAKREDLLGVAVQWTSVGEAPLYHQTDKEDPDEVGGFIWESSIDPTKHDRWLSKEDLP